MLAGGEKVSPFKSLRVTINWNWSRNQFLRCWVTLRSRSCSKFDSSVAFREKKTRKWNKKVWFFKKVVSILNQFFFKMKKFTALVFLLLTITMTSCQNNSNDNNGGGKATYTIVSPTVVRPNTDFLVAVSVFNIGIQDRKNLRSYSQALTSSGSRPSWSLSWPINALQL